jgi:hypothetical protein
LRERDYDGVSLRPSIEKRLDWLTCYGRGEGELGSDFYDLTIFVDQPAGHGLPGAGLALRHSEVVNRDVRIGPS